MCTGVGMRNAWGHHPRGPHAPEHYLQEACQVHRVKIQTGSPRGSGRGRETLVKWARGFSTTRGHNPQQWVTAEGASRQRLSLR